MKKAMTTMAIMLVAALALAPWAVVMAEASGAGSGSGAGAGAGAAGGAGAGPSGTSGSGTSDSGSPSGGTGGGTGAGSTGSTPSTSGSPSASPGVGAPSTAPATSPTMRHKDKTSTGGTMSSPSASVSGDWVGRHTMTGEVTKVNPDKGTFSLKTGEGTLDLHAPPSALAGVKRGDQMSVEIAVRPMR